MFLVIRKRNIIYSLIIITSFLIITKINISCIRHVMNATYITKRTIVIDAGHGGRDPGAIGINGTLEKHINLEIAQKLKLLLENNGYNVVMTRDKDILLNDEGVKNRKASDIKNRIKIINDSNCNMLISIHLNSFPDNKYYGAQVFYPKNNEEGSKLGKIIQDELKTQVDSTNNRVAKSIDTILMLKKLNMPSILVECGFLSNGREEELLKTDEHQQKIVESICSGVKKYFESEKEIIN